MGQAANTAMSIQGLCQGHTQVGEVDFRGRGQHWPSAGLVAPGVPIMCPPAHSVPASRAKLTMLNTVSKIRGQVKNPGYPQSEGLLGECMIRHGKELGGESNFGEASLGASGLGRAARAGGQAEGRGARASPHWRAGGCFAPIALESALPLAGPWMRARAARERAPLCAPHTHTPQG